MIKQIEIIFETWQQARQARKRATQLERERSLLRGIRFLQQRQEAVMPATGVEKRRRRCFLWGVER